MADYSYKKSNPSLSLVEIDAGTGVMFDGVLTTPEEVVVVSKTVPLTAPEEAGLDQYMLDLGFVKIFP